MTTTGNSWGSNVPQHPIPQHIETRWRRIVTPIPAPESLPLLERLRSVEPRSMSGMPPVVWNEAEGFLVRDGFGNQWPPRWIGLLSLFSWLLSCGEFVSEKVPRLATLLRSAPENPLNSECGFPGSEPISYFWKYLRG